MEIFGDEKDLYPKKTEAKPASIAVAHFPCIVMLSSDLWMGHRCYAHEDEENNVGQHDRNHSNTSELRRFRKIQTCASSKNREPHGCGNGTTTVYASDMEY